MQRKKPSLLFPFALTIILVSLSFIVLTQPPGKAEYFDYSNSDSKTAPNSRKARCNSLLEPSSEDLYCVSARQSHLAWLMYLATATVGSLDYTGRMYRRFLHAEWEEDEQRAKSQESSGGQESPAT